MPVVTLQPTTLQKPIALVVPSSDHAFINIRQMEQTGYFCQVYNGLSLNVVNVKTILYLNVALNVVDEMPANLLSALVLDRLGRKPVVIGTLWFSGILLLCRKISEEY
ncbi:Organic cation/carnitine transporter 4 [Capsicum baccatum]|uniref:Organic cation/carnitine transporter 4 n=1 Tax=Capsicum baccatum TaxID=33114 RepID=A0A2G2X877_CAPBA|nr:Organic cation/carnitine transporter 4 [Capsicum baccatum]